MLQLGAVGAHVEAVLFRPVARASDALGLKHRCRKSSCDRKLLGWRSCGEVWCGRVDHLVLLLVLTCLVANQIRRRILRHRGHLASLYNLTRSNITTGWCSTATHERRRRLSGGSGTKQNDLWGQEHKGYTPPPEPASANKNLAQNEEPQLVRRPKRGRRCPTGGRCAHLDSPQPRSPRTDTHKKCTIRVTRLVHHPTLFTAIAGHFGCSRREDYKDRMLMKLIY